jgi:AcrR family transcriptional regulator
MARDQRVDEILVAARDVFCEKGYEATAVASIADRIGVVEGTVYKYFATKRELLLKVLEHWYQDIFGAAARTAAGAGSAREKLHSLVLGHLRAIRDYPLLCRLMFREVRSEQDYHGSGLHEMNRRYTRVLLEVISQGSTRGEFRADLSPLLLRDLIYGGIEHHSWNYVCGRGELDIDRIADQITNVICLGIEPQPSSATP